MSACNTFGISGKHRNSIKCNLCLAKANLKRSSLNYVDSQYIKFSNKTWHYYKWNKNLFPFTIKIILSSILCERFYCNSGWNDSCLTLKPPQNLSDLSNEFNSFSSDINNIPENVINSNYYDNDQLQTFINITPTNWCNYSKL